MRNQFGFDGGVNGTLFFCRGQGRQETLTLDVPRQREEH